MEGEPVLTAAFPGESSGSMAASAAGREAMPGTGPGGEPDDEDDPDDEDNTFDEDDLNSQRVLITEALGNAEGVSAGRTLVDVAHKARSHGRGPPRRKKKPTGARKSLDISKHLEQKRSDVDSQLDAAKTSTDWKSMRRAFCWGTPCLIKLMAIVAGAALCLLLCSARIWYCWKRKRCFCACSEDATKNRGNENLKHYPTSSLLPLSALPWLHPRHEAIPKPTPPQRDPLPVSPLVLFPGQE
ncbi:uncharacterized protein LOC135307749 isoform X2 [Passer domesticus]|uniref:uncharacterized protein LOC135307749 isoform X2 n=1 Tax=Passer domesticus TaxID=48849 RepID=UPI0030FF26FA